MNQNCKKNLQSICKLLGKLSNKDYNQPIQILSNKSIRQHVCHIIRYYQCFIDGMKENCIDYAKRDFYIPLEKNRQYSIKKINTICRELNANLTKQKGVIIRYNTSHKDQTSSELVSNSLRELLFCLEHSIHHQKMIKIALFELGKLDLIDEHFGLTTSELGEKESLEN